MADFNALEALINAYIKQNGVQAITGQILNGVLRGMVSALGKGWTVAGQADPSTDPGTMTGPVAYIAHEAGTYTHFGGLVVDDGEVAFLKYNEQTWTKETLASMSAVATVDGNVGTPSVDTQFVNGVLTFAFHNMKGTPGEDGAAAGFGTVNATVDGNVGTPGVSVQSSGPDTAKNFTFQFTNLKGETGVTSVVVTVDNTSGTPACTASLSGQVLTLAFTGLKGAQGNPGSSVDYPFTLVNNLTTNDATQALTAAMGVQLESEITQLEAEVIDKTEYSDTITSYFTGDVVGYESGLQMYDGAFSTQTYSAVTIHKLIAGRKYKFAFNDNYGTTTSRYTILGYVNSPSDVSAGNSVTSLLTGDALVSGWSLELTPTEDKYLCALWRTDASGDYIIPRVTITEDVTSLIEVKDVIDEPYFNTQETDITENYEQITNGIEGRYGSFRSGSYVKIAVYKLLAGKKYRFVYNNNYQSSTSPYTILGQVLSTTDVSLNTRIFYNILRGNNLVEGYESFITPASNIYIFIRWRADSSGDTYNPCLRIYEITKNIAPIVDMIGNLSNLVTQEKSSLVSAVNEIASGPLQGKILAVDGDSICAGAGYAGGYAKIIAERNGMTLQNNAVGGGTIAAETYAGETPRHWICRSISSLRADADYIILEGGVNDTAGGTMTDYFTSTFDDTTFVGACEVMCRDLLQRFKGKKVGFIIVHQVYGFTNFRASDTKYKNLVAVLKKWGVPYCDLNIQVPAFGLLESSDTLVTTYTKDGDGWHPNEAGYKKYYCDKIEAWLKTL